MCSSLYTTCGIFCSSQTQSCLHRRIGLEANSPPSHQLLLSQENKLLQTNWLKWSQCENLAYGHSINLRHQQSRAAVKLVDVQYMPGITSTAHSVLQIILFSKQIKKKTRPLKHGFLLQNVQCNKMLKRSLLNTERWLIKHQKKSWLKDW